MINLFYLLRLSMYDIKPLKEDCMREMMSSDREIERLDEGKSKGNTQHSERRERKH
jgi:hypothetical protein